MAQIIITIDDSKANLIRGYLLSLVPDESTQPDLSTGAKLVSAFKAHIIAIMKEKITRYLIEEKRKILDMSVDDPGVS